jgi:ABC-type multidrug transport system fused ATPase/permease subunit
MTTLPEAVFAREAAICYAHICVPTGWCMGELRRWTIFTPSFRRELRTSSKCRNIRAEYRLRSGLSLRPCAGQRPLDRSHAVKQAVGKRIKNDNENTIEGSDEKGPDINDGKRNHPDRKLFLWLRGRKNLALKHVSFSVNEGEFLGVIGCNKAGKSTLCQSMVGVLPYVLGGRWEGTIHVAART